MGSGRLDQILLGRSAAALYWMSRYVERAENMARLAEVGYRISLMPRASEGHRDEWRSTLQSCGCEQSYIAQYGEITGSKVIQHLLFDESNPGSIRSSISTARNNARAVRTALTRDVWEALNTTWNDLSRVRPDEIETFRLPGFLEWVRQRSMLFRGAMVSTMLRKDTFSFSQLGTFIERADSTARIIDVKYYLLLPDSVSVGGETDMQQWAQILRSVSAKRAYRWLYRDSGHTPFRIAEFLILREEMPRSLLFCYRRVTEALDGLYENYGERRPCHEAAQAIAAELAGKDMAVIFRSGLHEYLGRFMEQNNALSNRIAADYNFP
jgi:uncharacterized alpha-E superfamily protein